MQLKKMKMSKDIFNISYSKELIIELEMKTSENKVLKLLHHTITSPNQQ